MSRCLAAFILAGWFAGLTGHSAINLPKTEPILGYGFESAFSGVVFKEPVAIAAPSGETNALYVAEREGRIMVIRDLRNPVAEVFLDLQASTVSTNGEAGLLGLTFHPDFKANGRFFVFRTQLSSTNFIDILSEFHTRVDGTTDATTEKILISQLDLGYEHNAGCLQFGPDGYLYVAVGFEGISGQERKRQRLDEGLFGGILRLDVDNRPENLEPNDHPSTRKNYRIPRDNPFVGIQQFNGESIDPTKVLTEFFAIGLRNPWRFSFDPYTGELICGDVGEGFFEEVNVVEKGQNYGWPYLEGRSHRIQTNGPPNLKPPIYEYYHGPGQYEGRVIIGGVVYSGTKHMELRGKYLFADLRNGHVWTLNPEEQNAAATWITGQAGISTFGLDPRDGEVLVANLWSGLLYKLVYRSDQVLGIPRLLSEVGAFSDLQTLETTNATPYEIIQELWSDGAIKTRWVSLEHAEGKFTFHPQTNWAVPAGTIFIKHFELETTNGVPSSRRRLETRFLVKTTNSVYGVSYRWNGSNDAELISPGGLEENITISRDGVVKDQKWVYPAWVDCKTCHSQLGGRVLGFNTWQLNRPLMGNSSETNQLEWLRMHDFFSNPQDVQLATLPKYSALSDTNAPLQHRVRSYLNSNCVQCHQPGAHPADGSWGSSWDARLTTPIVSAAMIEEQALFYPPPMKIIARRDIEKSFLYHRTRVSTPDEWFRMPPLSTKIAHPLFIETLTNWIASLPESDWRELNIGTNILEGSAEQYPTGMQLSGSGAGAAEGSIFFSAKPIWGEFALGALLRQGTNFKKGEAGIMLRGSAEPTSTYAALYVRGLNLVFEVRKSEQHVSEVVASVPARSVTWLRLERSGGEIRASRQDGAGNWELIGVSTVLLNPEVLAGLYVSSGEVPAKFATAEFSDYFLNSLNISLESIQDRKVRVGAIRDRFNQGGPIKLESSPDMQSWIEEEDVTVQRDSSTRQELNSTKPASQEDRRFFRIRRDP